VDEGAETLVRSKDVHVWFCDEAEFHPWDLTESVSEGASSPIGRIRQFLRAELAKEGVRTDGGCVSVPQIDRY